MRPGRFLVGLLLAYVALDLGSPVIPGAFSFDPDDCVDGFRGDRTRATGLEATPLAARTPQRGDDVRPSPRAERPRMPAVAGSRRMAPLPRADLAGAPPSSRPPSPDDH